jgi:hypothetical protein
MDKSYSPASPMKGLYLTLPPQSKTSKDALVDFENRTIVKLGLDPSFLCLSGSGRDILSCQYGSKNKYFVDLVGGKQPKK